MNESLSALLSVLIPVLLTGLFNVWLFRLQQQKEKRSTDAAAQKAMNEAWKMVNDELKLEIKRLKDDRDAMREELNQAKVRISVLEREESLWIKERKKMSDKIAEFERRFGRELRALKNTTEDLKAKTGPLPPQPRKNDDTATG